MRDGTLKNINSAVNKLKLLGVISSIIVDDDDIIFNIEEIKREVSNLVIPEGVTKLDLRYIPKKEVTYKVVELVNKPIYGEEGFEDKYKREWEQRDVTEVIEKKKEGHVVYEIKHLKLPDSMTSIERRTFEYIGGIEEITLGKNCTHIGRCAFNSCTSLKKINIPDICADIEDNAFSGAGLKKLKLPQSLKEIGRGLCNCCEELTEVVMPENGSLREIKSHAFAGCVKLNKINIPKGCRAIEAAAFQSCWDLKQVELPDSVRELGQRCFCGSGIESIEFPDKLMEINNEAFRDCENLTEVSLPDSLEELGRSIFICCNNLRRVRLSRSKDITAIPDRAFFKCAIESLEVPENIIKIEENAFGKCTSLVSVKLPESLLEIRANAFDSCRKLKNINIPSQCKNIGSGAFTMTDIRAIKIPRSVKRVRSKAFRLCFSLEEVIIEGPIKKVEAESFNGCFNLERVILPKECEDIGESAFKGCQKLKNIQIPSNMKSIKTRSFVETGITSLEIPMGCSIDTQLAFEKGKKVKVSRYDGQR